MPNWCANRIELCGASDALDALQPLLSGDVPAAYETAVRQSLRLFLAGCAGLLRPVAAVTYAPYPALVQHGTGRADRAADCAFTQWLALLQRGAELDDDTCERIDALHQESGLGECDWHTLPEAAKTVISGLLQKKGHDWGSSWLQPLSVAEHWAALNTRPEKGRVMDLVTLVPTRLDVEINGFNGGFLAGVSSAYDHYVRVYGTKWPCGYDTVLSRESGCLTVDFDTPWSPPEESVVALLARDGITVTHYYSEAGCDYCGIRVYRNGELAELEDGCLEYGYEEDDDGCRDVTGPAWLVGNVPNYGG